jgi:Mg2+/citrate symporter
MINYLLKKKKFRLFFVVNILLIASLVLAYFAHYLLNSRVTINDNQIVTYNSAVINSDNQTQIQISFSYEIKKPKWLEAEILLIDASFNCLFDDVIITDQIFVINDSDYLMANFMLDESYDKAFAAEVNVINSYQSKWDYYFN